jgi:ubiquinone/menaquinone biosynthesis C-methylase UbiE
MSMKPNTEDETKRRTAALFSAVADTYDTVIPFFATLGRRLVDAAQLEPGERVLDLACGRGACLHLAAAAVGERGHVLGIDVAESMVAATAAELRAAGARQAEVRVGDAEHLELPDASFDAIVCGFGVFFFPDPAAALGECRRVLRPGGRLAASTFTGGRGGYPWAQDVARELGKEPPGPKSPLRSAFGLRSALAAAGFAEIQTSDVEARFVFPDVDALIAWNRSHAGRILIDSLDPAELARYRALLSNRLRSHAVPDGFELIQKAQITIAYRPR